MEGAEGGLRGAAQSRSESQLPTPALGAWPAPQLSGLPILPLKPKSSILLRKLATLPVGLSPRLGILHTTAARFSTSFQFH